jgi:hypothetical protein
MRVRVLLLSHEEDISIGEEEEEENQLPYLAPKD